MKTKQKHIAATIIAFMLVVSILAAMFTASFPAPERYLVHKAIVNKHDSIQHAQYVDSLRIATMIEFN